VQPGLQGVRICRRGCPKASVFGPPHPARGAARSFGSRLRAFGRRRRVQASGLGGSEDSRRGRRTLQRSRNPGEDRPSVRGNSCRRERTRERIKASKWVKLAERDGSVARPQSDREGSPSGGTERELIVVGGSRQLRVSVGVSETDGDKDRAATSLARRWMTAREQSGPERGARLERGETSGGGIPERLWHETRPRSLGLLGNR